MKFAGAKIITPINEIEKMVIAECIRIGNKEFPSVAPKIESAIRFSALDIFKNTEEYKSLVNGILKGHFGLEIGSAQQMVDDVVHTACNGISVAFTRLSNRGGNISGGFRISGFQSDFNDLLALDSSHQITDKGQDLPWLEWLLLEGDRIIIYDYYFAPGGFYKTSRSGQGIMIFEEKAYWKVPAKYAGTKNKNWITKAVESLLLILGDIIESTFLKYL